MDTYTVDAERAGTWWALSVREAPDIHTQVKRIDQAEDMAREAIALTLEVEPTSFDVNVITRYDDESAGHLEDFEAHRNRAARAKAEADACDIATARMMRDAGYSLRDIAAGMHLSYQRVHQLIEASPPTCPICKAPGEWDLVMVTRHSDTGPPRRIEALAGKCSADNTHWYYPGPVLEDTGT